MERKRPHDDGGDGGDSVDPGRVQRRRTEQEDELSEQERLLRMVAEDDEQLDALDATGLRRLVFAFEKRLSKNQELRIKYPDDPQKFMESEIELHAEVNKLHVIATVPELYDDFIKTGSTKSLIALLAHENTDISIAVVDFLKELTDDDAAEDNREPVCALVDCLVSEQLLPALTHNMARLNEQVSDESDGVHTTLGVIENMVELRPPVATELVRSTTLVDWLLKRLGQTPGETDQNRAYAAEMLAILMQVSEDCREFVAKGAGLLERLLRIVSFYRKVTVLASGSDAEEIMENLFDSICSLLMSPTTRRAFLEVEGIDLMVSILKCKQSRVRGCALKVLSYALGPPSAHAAVLAFVNALGLKSFFPAFLKSPSKSESEYEEHLCSVLVSLLSHTVGEADKAVRARILNKFVENDFAKVDRLIAIHDKYRQRMDAFDVVVTAEVEEMEEAGEEVDETVRDNFYVRRLEKGLSTLQLADAAVLLLITAHIPPITERVVSLLHVRSASLRAVCATVREYVDNLDAAVSGDIKSALEAALAIAGVDKGASSSSS